MIIKESVCRVAGNTEKCLPEDSYRNICDGDSNAHVGYPVLICRVFSKTLLLF